MAAASAMYHSNTLMDIRWSPMVVFSVALHLGVFLAILFIPGSFSTRRQIGGPVYEVSLVEMPAGGAKKTSSPASSSSAATQTPVKPSESAKRIPSVKKEPEKKVIAERTSPKPVAQPKKPTTSPSQQINDAIAKLETKYKSPDINRHLTEAINRIKAEVEESGVEGSGTEEGSGIQGGGGTTVEGYQIILYQIEVQVWVKSKWAYPAAAQNNKGLEAVVVLQVKNDGTILKSTFQRRSNDIIFDESVQKAVERSNPLPPFPEGYRKSYDEIEIIFNLKDLENS
jgi:colicin import membrane protein